MIPLLTLASLLFKRTSSLLILAAMSITIGGFLFGVIFSFTQSINTYLIQEGRVLVGGDAVISSPYPIDKNAQLLVSLKEKGVTTLDIRSFQGVFSTKTGTTSQAEIRAVGDEYPLYGKVLLRDDVNFSYEASSLYAEGLFLERLGVSVGDVVSFAGKDFTIRGEILKEPDGIATGISFAPKVIVFLDDVNTINVPLSESRTRYRMFFKGDENIFNANDRASLKAYATENKLRFDDATDGPNSLLEGFSSLDDFIAILLAVALFLVVINIGANLSYLLAKYRKTIALLKIHGASENMVRNTFIILLGFVGIFGGVIGSLLGVYGGEYALLYVQELYAINVTQEGKLAVVVLGGLFGLIFILLSALPFLKLVSQVKSKELLLNTVSLKQVFSLKKVLLYVPIPLFVSTVLYGVSKNILIASLGVVVCGAVFLFFMMIVYGILYALYRIREKMSFVLRSIISFLYLRKAETLVSSSAIMTAFLLVFLVLAVEKNIETNLRQNIATTAPSLYVIDITKSQLQEVKAFIGETFNEYPIVRGRLLFVDQRDILKEDNRELRREFNLTYRDTLIQGEKVIEGVFGDNKGGTVIPVSLDKDFAREIGGATIGSTIVLFIQGIELRATVTSIREVDSRSGIPFFYFVFPKSVLEKYPATFFGTAEVDDQKRRSIESYIANNFPNIIPIVTSSLIAIVTETVETVVQVVTLLSVPSVALGLFLIIVMIFQNMYERRSDVLVLRAFGMSRKRVTILFVVEGSFLVIVSGLISYVVAHLLAYILNVTLFSFTLFSFAITPFAIIIAVLVCVVTIATLLSRSLAKSSLKHLLNEK
jgi:putative ABC transport system permease protein